MRKNRLKSADVNALKQSFKGRSGVRFEEFLLTEGLVSREDLLEALGEYYTVPTVDVVGQFLDHHVVRMFPLDVMLRYHFVPFERDGDMLAVVAAEPDDPELLDIIGTYVSYDIVLMAGYIIDIDDMAEDFYDESLTEEHKELSIDEERELEKEADAMADILEAADIRKDEE